MPEGGARTNRTSSPPRQTLGQGTYAIVKEAVHIKTGKYYACKVRAFVYPGALGTANANWWGVRQVINKTLMAGREHMVRPSLASTRSVSESSPRWKARGGAREASSCASGEARGRRDGQRRGHVPRLDLGGKSCDRPPSVLTV